MGDGGATGAVQQPAGDIVYADRCGDRLDAWWVDERGRVRRPLPATPRRPLAIDDAVARFVAWLREECDTHGDDGNPIHHTSDDMVEAYELWCAEAGVEQESRQVFLEALGEAEGIVSRRVRLGRAVFAPIRARLALIARVRGAEPPSRPELYRVLSHDELADLIAGAARADAAARHPSPGTPEPPGGGRRQAPGRARPVLVEAHGAAADDDADAGAASGAAGSARLITPSAQDVRRRTGSARPQLDLFGDDDRVAA